MRSLWLSLMICKIWDLPKHFSICYFYANILLLNSCQYRWQCRRYRQPVEGCSEPKDQVLILRFTATLSMIPVVTMTIDISLVATKRWVRHWPHHGRDRYYHHDRHEPCWLRGELYGQKVQIMNFGMVITGWFYAEQSGDYQFIMSFEGIQFGRGLMR